MTFERSIKLQFVVKTYFIIGKTH